MRSFTTSAAFALLSGVTVVSASYPLATITPCPSCPKSVCPELITVTSQYQPVSTCEPVTSYGAKSVAKVSPSCSSYDYVSTVIPCLGGKENTTVTKTDQIVKISHVSTVLTSYSAVVVPCPTQAPSYNGTFAKYKASNCSITSTSTKYQTMIVDTSCPYNKIGPLAIPGYEGSGLCKDCSPDVDGSKSQNVHVSKCIDGACSTYAETWVSRKAAPATSASAASYSSSAYCSAGVNTIPVTTTCTPSGGAYTKPVTSTFAFTTSVAKAQDVVLQTSFTVYFTGKASSVSPTSTSAAAISASTYCSKNGVYTIPIVQTVKPSNSAYEPITTTALYTTKVTNAPVQITCTKTVTVFFTTTFCPETIVSGSTVKPTSYPTYPATVSAEQTHSSYPVSTSGASYPTYPATVSAGQTYSSYPFSTSDSTHSQTNSVYPTSGQASPTTTSGPQPTESVGDFEYFGCVGSNEGFPTFNLIESSGLMTVELCTSECSGSGFTFAGLYSTDCYCASSISDGTATGQANGVCDIPCPGNPLESCGGNAEAPPRLRNRAAPNNILLDVYEQSTPTSTSSTETGSATTSATPDPSSDPDPTPEPPAMEAPAIKARNGTKTRRSGILRNANKAVKGPALARRDYGLKKNALI